MYARVDAAAPSGRQEQAEEAMKGPVLTSTPAIDVCAMAGKPRNMRQWGTGKTAKAWRIGRQVTVFSER